MNFDIGKIIQTGNISFDEKMDHWILNAKVDKHFEWTKRWTSELPYLNFPSNFLVKIIPPYACAIVRFLVRLKDSDSDKCISVYFDGYNILGMAAGPYWEIFDSKDSTRFLLGEETAMIEEIEKRLK